MNYYGTAEMAAESIVRAFEEPNTLPAPLASLFVKSGDGVPCRQWSWRNQLLVALAGSSDARGFRQWQAAGRWVVKGEKSFTILAPVVRGVRSVATGEERQAVLGFRGVCVFGVGQTDGRALPAADPEAGRWVEELPLVEVARRWGLSVEAFDGHPGECRGVYRRGRGVALGVKNLSVWCHELVHAADDRAGNLKETGQHWRSETVAQLGAAVLLKLLGCDGEADLGGSWHYIAGYAKAEGIEVVGACCQVLERTCQAVKLVLDSAGEVAGAGTAAGPDAGTPAEC